MITYELKATWLQIVSPEFAWQCKLWNEPDDHPYWLLDRLATEWVQIVWPI